MNRFFFIFLIGVISSCARPHYREQFVALPYEWRFEANEESTLCNLRWWEQFDDPVLNELIMKALMQNQNLKAAILNVLKYYYQYAYVRSDLFPMLDLHANYSRTQISDFTPNTPLVNFTRTFDTFLLTLNLNWELDFWGRIHSASEAAFHDMLGQAEARRAVVLSLVTAVANAYIELRALDLELEIAKNTAKSREDYLQLAQSRFELGETSELEVVQARSQLDIAAIQVTELEKQIPIQEDLLSVLIGENPHEILRGKSIEDFRYPVTIPAGIPSELLVRRPDIMQAEEQMIAANARVYEARALLFPKITLTGYYGSQSSLLSKFLTAPSEIWQYSIDMVQNVFDAGKRCYKLKEAKADRNRLLFTYRDTILNAFKEVNDALITSEKNKKLAAQHEEQVNNLTQYLNLARLRYEEGEVDYLNVLDAERTLFDAQLQLVQSQADNFQAVVQLYGALGGGWVVDADDIGQNSLPCH